MRKLYKIVLDGNKAYLTREFNGETLFAGIDNRGRQAEAYGPLWAARDAIRRRINLRRLDLRHDFVKGQFVTGDNWKYTISAHPGRIFKMLKSRKRDVLNQAKYPKTKSKYVGVEIEFISSWNSSEIKDALLEANLAEYTNLTTDGSVRAEVDCNGSCYDCDGRCYQDSCECRTCDGSCENDSCRGSQDECDNVICDCDMSATDGVCDGGHSCQGGHECPGDHECHCECQCECRCGGDGHELRVLAKESEISSVIVKVCKVLKEVDASVNKTCGLHVHLDMRSRDVKQCFSNLVTVQPLLYSMVPKSRRRGFSVPNVDKVFKELSCRYVGINPNSFRKHKTVEVRLHSGTVCAVKINNWVELLLSVVRYEFKIDSIKTLKGITSRLQLSPKLVTYIKERSLKFKNEHTFDVKSLDQAA